MADWPPSVFDIRDDIKKEIRQLQDSNLCAQRAFDASKEIRVKLLNHSDKLTLPNFFETRFFS